MKGRKIISSIAAAVLSVGLIAGCGAAGVNGSESKKEQTEELTGVTIELSSEDWNQISKVDSSIYVEKVEGLPSDFISGMDISSYLSEKKSGVKYYDYDGNELDDQGFFRFLHDVCGVNYVRIRIWNDPKDEDGNDYGGGNCDLENAKAIGKLAADAGMKTLIDYHYSDFWADPGKQRAPKAWESMTLEEKAKALTDYTDETLRELLNAGVAVGMVQIGNETNKGMAGETTAQGKCTLYNAGSQAVRTVAAAYNMDILVAVHYTNPEQKNYRQLAQGLKSYKVDYDVFATSYYPYWHGTTENLTQQLKEVAEKFGKKVMLVETSYIHTYLDGDGHGNTESEGKAGDKFYYDVSEQGQADAIRDAVQAIAAVGEAGIGVFYWEPAWIPVQVCETATTKAEDIRSQNQKIWEEYGSGWATSYAGEYDKDAKDYYGGSAVDNEALFDFYGHPLESARIFYYVRTGTNAEILPVSASVEDVEFGLNYEVKLPDMAKVRYNDGSTKECPVSWSEADIALIDTSTAGSFSVYGTTTLDGNTFPVKMTVTVIQKNEVPNGNFEDEDGSMWVISDGKTASIDEDTNNSYNGEHCLHFWSSGDVNYTAEQTFTLKAGKYRFGAFLEGGDCGDQAKFTLYMTVGGETQSVDAQVAGWQVWQNPEIAEIVVDQDTEVTVGVSGTAAAGGWGAWDEIYLYELFE